MTATTCVVVANAPGADAFAEAARECAEVHSIALTPAAAAVKQMARVLESAANAATLVYIAGTCARDAARRTYVGTAAPDPSPRTHPGVSLDTVLEMMRRSPRARIVLAIDCVVGADLDAAETEFGRLFEDVRPDIHVLVAPVETSAASAEPTPLSTFLLRALREDAFSVQRAPESVSSVIDALWRLKQVPAPLWRWPPQPRRPAVPVGEGRFQDSDVRAAERSAPAPVGPTGQPGRLLVELGGTGTIWYATNRRPTDPSRIVRGYSAELDTKTHYGRCSVFVPMSHRIGSTGSHWWTRLARRTDDRLKLTAIDEMDSAAYWKNLRGVLEDLTPDARDVLVFVHGFNVTFEEAALRAAQIACDLQFPGTTAFFSWPSKGSADPSSYSADGACMENSEGAIADFLCSCADQTGANRVHVIAHSMGNRGLLRALTGIVDRAARSSGARFGHFILAAPDVDRGTFLRLAAAYHRVAQHTTLYVSGKDRALQASALLHDAPRVGFSPPVTVVANIDTIEVQNVDLTLLGHGYVGAARDVLRDMYELLVLDAPPFRRAFLRPAATAEGEPYWIIAG